MKTLPMRTGPVVRDQVLRRECRTAALRLMRLRDRGQRLDYVDCLKTTTQRGSD
jgi:hypothetical protein